MNRLRHRMILAAAIVALLPAVPLSMLVRNLLERSFASPLFDEVDEALEVALAISREELHREKEWLADASAVLGDAEERARRAAERAAAADAGDRPLFVVELDADGTPRGALPDEVSAWLGDRAGDFPSGTPERVGGHLVLMVGEAGSHRVLARALPPASVERAGRITDAVAMRHAMRAERDAVLRGYVVPFVLTYALLLVAAAGVAAFVAGRIARPVEALADAARRVGAGDLSTRVTAPATGEVGDLVAAFNRMVGELEAQQRELARLERLAAWRDLARTLAHEIKNPLTPIQLAIQQLADQAPKDDDDAFAQLARDCVEIVNEEVESLRRLTREFSEFARLPQPQPEAKDLVPLLEDLGRLYAERLECRPAAAPLPARYDEKELRRALINLIDNGIAACAEAGRDERVVVTASTEGNDTVLRVTDDGDGVPAANRERIFEPNFSTKSEGMGLGLAIVDGIVRGHGGSIALEEGDGRGATFTIRLPAPPPDAAAATPPAAASAPEAPKTPPAPKGTP